MGDRLRAGKLFRYVTSHPGQLSLAIPVWVCAMSTSLGWEGNRSSGVALAMRHRHQWFIHYTGSTAYEREMSTPPTLLRTMALLYLFFPPQFWVTAGVALLRYLLPIATLRLELMLWNFQNRWKMALRSCRSIRQVTAPCNGARGKVWCVRHHLLNLVVAYLVSFETGRFHYSVVLVITIGIIQGW